MGTRNLTMIQKNNKMVLAQYCQWDGYPTGQGLVILEFLKNNDIEIFKKKVDNLEYVTEEKYKECWAEAGAGPEDTFVGMEIADKFNKLYPQLSRDTGAKVLDIIMNSEKTVLVKDSLSFAYNWSCEWGYVINLDTNQLEVYKCSLEVKENDRFYLKKEERPENYEPIVQIASYDFDNLPSERTFSRLESYYDSKLEEVLEEATDEAVADLILDFLEDFKDKLDSENLKEEIIKWLN